MVRPAYPFGDFALFALLMPVQLCHRFLARAACWACDLRCVAAKGAFVPVLGT